MLANVAPQNLDTALAGANGILALNAADPTAGVTRYVEAFCGTPNTVRVVVSNAFPITWAFGWSEIRGVIFMSGVRTTEGVTSLCRSWIDPQDIPRNVQVQLWANSIAEVMWARVTESGARPAAGWHLIGHSLGGALAHCLAPTIQRLAPQIATATMSFGAPKICDRLYSLSNRSYGCRYTNDGDQVPNLPPTMRNAALLYSGLSLPRRTRLNAWAHPMDETYIDAQGVISGPPGLAPNNVVASTLQAVVTGRVDGLFGPAHEITHYIDRLTLAKDRAAPSAVPPPVVTNPQVPSAPLTPTRVVPAEPPPLLTNPELNRIVATARTAATARDSVPVNIAKRFRPRAVRYANSYSVDWLGRSVAWAPTKKKALALCRHLNKFLKIYQTVGVSNSQLLVATLADYLTIAADPNGPIKPTLFDGGDTPNQFFPDLSIFGIEFAPTVP